MTTKTLTDLMTAAVEAFNRHDPDAFTEVYAEDAVVFDPMQPEPLRGRGAIRKDIVEFLTAFPDVKMEFVSKVSDGERLAAELKLTGTHSGPLATPDGEIAPTNRRFEMRTGAFIRANGAGKVVENGRYYDLAGLMEQLGVS
jgi:steroid delta-isomerase-like uncharacterized protein